MSISDKEARAAAYALGALDLEERRAISAEFEGDDGFSAHVEHWETVLAQLALALPSEMPPDGLFADIEAKIELQGDLIPGTKTIRASEGSWRDIGDGVAIKMLHRAKDSRRKSFFLRFAPGALLKAHPHQQDEECIVLEGDVSFGEVELKAGDFHVAPAGVPHPPAMSRNGCLLFITGAL